MIILLDLLHFEKGVGALLECRGEAPQLSPGVKLEIQKTDDEQERDLAHYLLSVIPVSSCLPVLVCLLVSMSIFKVKMLI